MSPTKTFTAGLFACAMALTAANAMAENKAPGSGPNPFTDCGIGAALFPDSHVLALSSNVIWDVGTTAVTSATASPETCSAKKVETAQFILDNYDSLAEQTAKGQGDHLTAMLNIMDCQSASHSAVIGTVRQDMAATVGQASYADQDQLSKASNYYNTVTTAATGCSA